MKILHGFGAVAVAAMLVAGGVRPASANTLLQPVQAQLPASAANLAQPVKPAGAARPPLSNGLAQPVQAIDPRPPCPCGAPPAPVVVVIGPDGAPITGDLSRLRPSERLLGREQALRARFGLQIHSGDRPWLPVPDDN